MAKQNLYWAKKACYLLQQKDEIYWNKLKQKIAINDKELQQFQEAAECMYLPVDDTLQINPQDDTFLQKQKWDFANTPKNRYPLLLHYHPLTIYRYQVCKQADTVLAHLLVEDEQTEKVIENSYHYYEQVTTHDSSLSSCVFGIMAARIGRLDRARSEEHTSELQSRGHLVCRLLLEKKKILNIDTNLNIYNTILNIF